jgi:hypothetical protein
VTLVKPGSCSDLVASEKRPPVRQYRVICLFKSDLSGKPTRFQKWNSTTPKHFDSRQASCAIDGRLGNAPVALV